MSNRKQKDVSNIPGKQRFFYVKLKKMNIRNRYAYANAVIRNPSTSPEDKGHMIAVVRENSHWFNRKDKMSVAERGFRVKAHDRSDKR